MKGIELLTFLDDEKKRMLEASERNYKRFARVYFRILGFDGREMIVKIWQMDNPAGKYLSAKELVERAKSVFDASIVPENVTIHVRPIPFERDKLNEFSAATVASKMQALGLQPKDLVKMLDIDKSSLSLMLNSKRDLSKAGRAMFYYFFKSMEASSAHQVKREMATSEM
ncbi:MAG: hypothetical protein LBR50_04430 [Tannerella sp.]|nr:hypothetical protein [Tannerella sp.]